MRFFSLTLITCFLLLQIAAKAQTDSFIVDGVYRNFTVHPPVGYNAGNAYPLVLNLHGYTSNAAQEEFYTQMDVSSDANHYFVVYPNGISNYWNSFGAGADDVKFLGELIDTISARYHINPKRVYSCGMSNGGYMSYTLACNLADRLAAIASVSGTMSTNTYSTCHPTRKIPIMHVHGTTDPIVPYATGATNSIGVELTLAFWRDTDACQMITDTIYLPNNNTADSSTVQRIAYPNCANGNEILFYKVINGGHTWPGSPVSISTYGNTNRDISATDEIWNFFNRYTLDGLNVGICCEPLTTLIRAYPNPAENMLNIASDYDVVSADIYDDAGRRVLSSVKSKKLDISALEPGVYIVKIACAQDLHSVIKFIKQ